MKRITSIVLAAASLVGLSAAVLNFTAPTSTVQAQTCLPNVASSFETTWPDRANKPGEAIVRAKGPLCQDVTVWFSSYTLPKNYDNSGLFGGPTSYPQARYASTKIVMQKGTTGEQTVRVKEPNLCETAAQFDIYPREQEITQITDKGGIFSYGVPWAVGFVVKRDQSKCPPPTPPVKNNIQVCRLKDKTVVTVDEKDFDSSTYSKDMKRCEKTPATPEVPKTPETPKADAEVPAELPTTGPESTLAGLGLIGLLSGSVVAYLQSRRS